MSDRKELFTPRNIATFGVLFALTVVLQLWASAIPMFGITLNLSLIPIALAGIFFGAGGGALIGLVSGSITFIVCALLGGEPSTAFLFGHSPVLLTITCIGKTTAAGALAGLFYTLISKKNTVVATFVASFAVPVLNTGLYVVGILLMKNEAAEFMGIQAQAGIVFLTLIGVIWLNFLLEIATTALLSPAVSTVVKLTGKKIRK